MAKTQTQNQQQAQNENGSFDLTLASLSKRGIELSSAQLSLCILYSRFNNIAYKVQAGLMTLAEATVEGDKAFAIYEQKLKKRSSVGF